MEEENGGGREEGRPLSAWFRGFALSSVAVLVTGSNCLDTHGEGEMAFPLQATVSARP